MERPDALATRTLGGGKTSNVPPRSCIPIPFAHLQVTETTGDACSRWVFPEFTNSLSDTS